MISENEKLRALLAEADKWLVLFSVNPVILTKQGKDKLDAFCDRLTAALAEPPPSLDLVARLQRERDEARAEVERLRNALAAISLDEYESTSSASEKVHGHARIARKALYGDVP